MQYTQFKYIRQSIPGHRAKSPSGAVHFFRRCKSYVLLNVVDSGEARSLKELPRGEQMRKAKSYQHVTKRFFRPEVTVCLECGTRLRRYATLACRTIIRLDGVVRVTHCGYRCPNPTCSARMRSYRSAVADALALPGFTFGLDIVIAVGHLRLARHQTLDEVHQHLLERLSPLGLAISRREIMYLFEAYCTLLRAAQQTKEGPEWQAWLKQVEENGGIILSIEGIQPDNGNETIYLVRDVLTGRVLCAENVTSSETEVIKALLRPVVE
jgi:hypothetical protein